MSVFQFYIHRLMIHKVVNYLQSDGTLHKMLGTYAIAFHIQSFLSWARLRLLFEPIFQQESIRYTKKLLPTNSPNNIRHVRFCLSRNYIDFLWYHRCYFTLLLRQKALFSLSFKDWLLNISFFSFVAWIIPCHGVYLSACFLVTVETWLGLCVHCGWSGL